MLINTIAYTNSKFESNNEHYFTTTLSLILALIRLGCMPDLLAVDGASLLHWD